MDRSFDFGEGELQNSRVGKPNVTPRQVGNGKPFSHADRWGRYLGSFNTWLISFSHTEGGSQ